MTMGTSKRLEWDKEGDGIRQVRFSDELPTGVTLTGTPTVTLEQRTSDNPETWVDRTSEVTISGELVVDSIDDEGTTNLGTNQAVQFQLDADPNPQPDVIDEPEPGDNYRITVVAVRSDSGDIVGKVPLTIMA